MILRRPRRQPRESIVPMINVVFLLLIFFLMTAQIAPPEPFEVTLPVAGDAGDPEGEVIAYINKAGQLGFEGLTGEEALNTLTDYPDKTHTLQIRADAKLEATKLAAFMSDLAEAGFARVDVMVAR